MQGEHSTIGDWFAGKSLPSRSSVELLERVLAVCGVGDERVIQQWISAWRRVRPLPGPQARDMEPYRGFALYAMEHAEWFFGRENLITELMRWVTRRHPAGGNVHLVVGASESGKSSLLRAGLIGPAQ
ncbi:hypothetical protein ACFY1U_34140 [Streptomyces sp. NPDC001351]|uniref:nSTAND1 domain-containing NTPase n=1 Tax=Streptomyces sp. NPDC001351 TaxID=3364564 RepID=UPI0036A35F05